MRDFAIGLLCIALASPAFAEPPTVPVTFLGRDPRIPYRLLVEGRSCTLPCALDVPPGPAHLLVAHPFGQMDEDIVLPPRPSLVTIDPANRINAVGGGIGLAFGTIFLGAGLGLENTAPPTPHEHDAWQAMGTVFLVGGLLLTGIGVLALSLIHGNRVTVN
jgi:hypothetical protein